MIAIGIAIGIAVGLVLGSLFWVLMLKYFTNQRSTSVEDMREFNNRTCELLEERNRIGNVQADALLSIARDMK